MLDFVVSLLVCYCLGEIIFEYGHILVLYWLLLHPASQSKKDGQMTFPSVCIGSAEIENGLFGQCGSILLRWGRRLCIGKVHDNSGLRI